MNYRRLIEEMDSTIRKLLKTISREREDLVEKTGYEREEYECYGCYRYDRERVRGEEMEINEFKDYVRISMKCPVCEKKWVVTITKDEGWKTRLKPYLKRFRRLEKERKNFEEKLKA